MADVDVKALQEENAKLRDALQNSRAMEAKLRKMMSCVNIVE